MENLGGKIISLKDLINATLHDPDIMCRLINKRGDTFKFRAPGVKGFVFSSPAAIKHIFTHNLDYIRNAHINKIVKNVFGPFGLLNVDDLFIWKKDRKSLNALFTPKKLESFSTVELENIKEYLNSWNTYAETNKPIYIEHHFTQLTLSNLLKTVFGGVRIPNERVPIISREIFYLTSPPIFPWVKLMGKIPMPFYSRYKKVRGELVAIGDEIVKQSFGPDVDPNNLITHLAKEYGYDTYESLDTEMKEHLNSEALTFLLAGHDSTSALLVHAHVYLSLYPLVAEKVYAEVKQVLGSRDPVYADIKQLVYTRAVLQETLRLWPPGTYFIRSPQEDDEIEGHSLKKGDMVIMPTYAMHRHSKYWPNPQGFDPERFMKPLSEEQKQLYMPFGKGKSSCIGAQFAIMQALFITAMISQRFRLELTPGCSFERDKGMVNRLNIDITMKVIKI